VSKQLAHWNSGTTRDLNPGPRDRIPSVLTTKPLSHTSFSVLSRDTVERLSLVSEDCGDGEGGDDGRAGGCEQNARCRSV